MVKLEGPFFYDLLIWLSNGGSRTSQVKSSGWGMNFEISGWISSTLHRCDPLPELSGRWFAIAYYYLRVWGKSDLPTIENFIFIIVNATVVE